MKTGHSAKEGIAIQESGSALRLFSSKCFGSTGEIIILLICGIDNLACCLSVVFAYDIEFEIDIK